jgi:thiamine biosynthesis lipoprotein
MQNRRDFLNVYQRSAPPSAYWLHVNRAAMACRFEITLPLSDQPGLPSATEALNEVERLEAQLTVFRDTSDVSQINRHAGNGSIHVESSLFDLLLLCRRLHRETEGAFDVTSGPLTRCWGFLRREGRLPTRLEIEQAQSCTGSDKLLFDQASSTIRFAQPGVEINLGSIGKGYALDRVASLLRGRARAVLLNAGSSSIRALGSGEQGQNGWEVGLRHPRKKNERMALLRLRDCALSTSGSEEQFFEHGGKRYGHIIDPRTGWPAESVTSVTVVAEDAAVSDALATAFYVGGRALAEKYCATHKNILAIMLESNSETPLLIGSNSGCAVTFL